MAVEWKKIAYNDEVGRSVTLTVAANDGTALEKAQADYVCDGTDDHVQIQAAIDALPATGGEVHLSSGTFINEAALVLDSYQTLRGQGRSTILTTTTANLDIITATGGDGTEKVGILIADLCIDGDAGAAANDMGIFWTYVDSSEIRNVWIIDTGEESIQFNYCDKNLITGNYCGNTTSEDCIYLLLSCHNVVSDNYCYSSGDSDGIAVEATSTHNYRKCLCW